LESTNSIDLFLLRSWIFIQHQIWWKFVDIEIEYYFFKVPPPSGKREKVRSRVSKKLRADLLSVWRCAPRADRTRVWLSWVPGSRAPVPCKTCQRNCVSSKTAFRRCIIYRSLSLSSRLHSISQWECFLSARRKTLPADLFVSLDLSTKNNLADTNKQELMVPLLKSDKRQK